jgi:NAD(P)-dependent dehydrogenase (short-subunit alcohol dehydrogenase family)
MIADVLEDAASEAAASLQRDGGTAGFVRYDATSVDDNHAAVERAVDELGGLDIVVTAAGVSHAGYRSGVWPPAAGREISLDPMARFTELPVDEWREVLDVNLTGTFLALQAAARRMLAAGRGGSIITIASIAAKHPEAGTPAYGASKAAVWMLTKHTAMLLGSAGIRVNAIGPGFIDTNMTMPLKAVPELYDQFIGQVPMGRMGTPLEIANTALFLASDESSYFTGEILHPDGGFYTD